MTNMQSEINGLPTNIRIPMRILGFINILILMAAGIGAMLWATSGHYEGSTLKYILAMVVILIGTFICFRIAPRQILAGNYLPGFTLLALPLIGVIAGGLVYLQSGLQVLQNLS